MNPAGLKEGDPIELRVTPDPYVTVRYAGASGDFNPIHIDDEFARSVGLPGRILHGLWTMAQVARAVGDGPNSLQLLTVNFRGMGRLGEEIAVSGSVQSVSGGVATVKLEANQGDTRLIRGAVAEVRLPAGS
jgi:3-hydroxybutyryl-CoA dehydratase